MTISAYTFVSIFLLTWGFRQLVDAIAAKRRGLKYPPGPKPKPFIGNLFDFPAVDAAWAYMEWEKTYNSPLLHAEALGMHILVINSVEDATALFERPDRARIYSDRPMMPVNDLMGWNDINVALMPYGEEWRHHRKICHQNFNLQAARQYEQVQTKKVRELLQRLLDTPEKFERHNKMYSVSVTIGTMYGHDIESIEDPLVALSDETLLLGSPLLVPGGSFINVIPALRYIPEWFPGAYSRKVAAKVRRKTEEVLRLPLEYVKTSFEAGTVIPSLVTDFYEKKHTVGASEEEEDIIKNIAYTVYGAASDTTISFTGSFFYLMTVNPDVQKKAQIEIDMVVGSKRLPALVDRQSLPYVEAIYREVMRLWPPLPLGLPHALSEDDYYKGYFIPKGTAVFTNIWAMSHNEKTYSDPYKFKPERYFDKEGKLTEEKILVYGFGRRRALLACVGKHLASSTVWLMMVSILATFNITKLKDKDGNDIELNDGFQNDGLMLHKSKFDCSFQPRSLSIRKLVADEMEYGSHALSK